LETGYLQILKKLKCHHPGLTWFLNPGTGFLLRMALEDTKPVIQGEKLLKMGRD
jgi:hypothetical protein